MMKRLSSGLLLSAALVLLALYSFATGTPSNAEAAAATRAATVPATKIRPTPTATPVASIPLYFGANNGTSLYDGDIWLWTVSQLTKITNSKHNEIPIVSPNGDYLVYQQVPAAFNVLEPNHDNDIPPYDLYLYNLKSGQTTLIAGQSGTVMLDPNLIKAHYTVRSRPCWSPDGKALAWTEALIAVDGESVTNGDEQLVSFDLNTKQKRIVVDKMPAARTFRNGSFPIPLLSVLSWGPTNLIAALTRTSEDIDPNDVDSVNIFDLQGHLVSSAPAISSLDANFSNTDLIWLRTGQSVTISCVGCRNQIVPATGEVLPVFGPPEAYSLLAPDKLSMYFGQDSGDESNVTWVIALNGKQVSKFDSVRIAQLTDFGISPDGMQVAAANFAGQGSTAGIFIYRAKTPDRPPISLILNITGMTWGPIGWRLHRDYVNYDYF